MSDKHFIGLKLTEFEDNGIQRPISRVTLHLDDENVLTAGDDTGFTLEADCPHATQAMVNTILANVKGYKYHMFTAEDGNLDPAAERGDGVTASRVYSILSRITDNESGYPSVSAPGEEELEDEYPGAGGPMTNAFNQKIAETRSRITKTAEEIRLEVEAVDGRVSSISQTVDSIQTEVRGLGGNYSSLKQYVDSITLDVSNGSTSSTISLKAGDTTISSKSITMDGLVTFQGLANGTTTIDGGCIKTGSIESINIKGVNITGSTIKGNDIEGGTINGGTINGGEINGGTINGGSFGKERIDINGIGQIYGEYDAIHFSAYEGNIIDIFSIYSGTDTDNVTATRLLVGPVTIELEAVDTIDFYSTLDMHNHSIVNHSDARLKENIQISSLDALGIINSIKTYSFDWKDGSGHKSLGFIAQQLLAEASPDFVMTGSSDGYYRTKDMDMIPYLVRAIQQLSQKINEKGAAT